jgi:hypothetical protein
MSTASTQMPRKVFFDHTFIGIRASLEQRCHAHQNATDAIPALTGLFFHEGSQNRLPNFVVYQTLCGLNAAPITCPKGR